jgi:phage/plasmid-associated DNA primase
LKNAIQESLVICPDRDKDGIARGLQVASFFPHAQWLYANPDHYAWSNPELGSGYDLGNWLDELTAQGKDEDELFNTVMGAVEKTARTFKPLPEVESRPKAVETQQQLKPNFESKPDSDYPHFTDLEPLDEVKNTTIDDHVFKRIFEAGKGDYKVINSAFYKYTGAGYWAHIDDEVVEQTIAKYTRNAYKAKRNERGEVVAINFPYAKTGNVSSAFSFSRTLLSSTQNTPYNRHLLCFKNCTVDLRTGDILEHNQDDILTSTIAADYEPGLPCPDAFGEFVYGAFGEDIFEVIQAVTSMLLDPTAPYGQFRI